eukprot:CAMPEP_0184700420 /NCGR_PEP_ID=MMETSP0313-20130426/13106_1 /TAXON_ID=2792 /ORGANISM="Porphyridium aerugineum, Strain SAG 1380-2" /LENGTH=39 /DNA_ID= /DNA_START= /DNA_END= /DNA_ORIENTATION=
MDDMMANFSNAMENDSIYNDDTFQANMNMNMMGDDDMGV